MPPSPAPPARRAGLIINPFAGKGHGKGLALAEKLRGAPGVLLEVLETFDQLQPAIDRLAGAGVSDLFISSGDGTIQEILTQVAERRPFAGLPRICLLPHGTTNLSANDLGFRSHAIEAQAAFVRSLEPRETVGRNTIRCLNPGDGRLRHGMFVGTGAISLATRYCQQAFNAQGIRGQWAVAKTLVGAVGKYLVLPPNRDDEARFDHPHAISVDAQGRRITDGPLLLQMSTTLDRLLLGSHPFWGGKTAAIRTTVIPYPVPSVLRWILPVMYGGESHRSPPGTQSFCSEAVDVSSDTIFVIDGEFFPPPVNEPLRMETGPLFTFVRG